MIHIDFNVVIALLNNRQPQIRARFDAARAAGTPLGLSMIVYHELMYGAAHSQRRTANEDKIALFVASGGSRYSLSRKPMRAMPPTSAPPAPAGNADRPLRRVDRRPGSACRVAARYG